MENWYTMFQIKDFLNFQRLLLSLVSYVRESEIKQLLRTTTSLQVSFLLSTDNHKVHDHKIKSKYNHNKYKSKYKSTHDN